MKEQRHQCLIYSGAPSRHLRAIAEIAQQKLSQNHRCFYLNSPPMVAGMRCYLAAAGVDVTREIEKGCVILSSDRGYLDEGKFNVDWMILSLEDSANRAVSDGYQGLWATGDMTWEFGPRADFEKLLEYEWRLERLFRKCDHLSGICQYHTDTLPNEATGPALLTHSSLFVNESLSRINPHYITRVTDYAGRVLEEDYPEVKDVVSERTARIMTSMLREVVLHGTGIAASKLPFPVAGKTGTTNDFTDAWFVGFSPTMTCGVWVGYDEKKSLGAKETGAHAALPIWMNFMTAAMAGKDVGDFQPSPIQPRVPQKLDTSDTAPAAEESH